MIVDVYDIYSSSLVIGRQVLDVEGGREREGGREGGGERERGVLCDLVVFAVDSFVFRTVIQLFAFDVVTCVLNWYGIILTV